VARFILVLVLEVLLVAGLLFAVAMVAAGRGDSLAKAWRDRPRHEFPNDRALDAADLDAARFGVGFRGYRMDEVDAFVDRVAAELTERDRRLAALETEQPREGQPDEPAD
jgi:DivIVA domain-containing protein